MKQKHADYQVIPFPKMRRLMSVAYRSAQHKPMIYGLLEVDGHKSPHLALGAQSANRGVPVVYGVHHCLPGQSR